MANKLYFLVMDLGINSDPTPLFEWLDEHDARECGEGAATFFIDASYSTVAKTLASRGKGGKDGIRLYLIGRKENGNWGGTFIAGARKRRPPWEGYAVAVPSEEEEPQ